MFFNALMMVFACDGGSAPEPTVDPEPATPSLDDITFLTEEYPPFNYTADDQLDGASVALLEAALKKAGASKTRADFTVVKWADGYERVQKEANTCLFSMTYTPERAPLFQWAGPIAETRIAVIAKKDAGVTISAAEDLANYTHGAFKDDVGQQLLATAGVPADKVKIEADTAVLMKDLSEGTIQTWAFEESSARYQLTAAGYDASEFETVYVLQESTVQYAFHKDTPPALISQLSQALGDLQASGERQKILDAHLK